jgi:exosortase
MHLLFLAAAIAIGFIVFWSVVYQVGYGVLHRQGSSHGVFIPFMSAYFIFLKRDLLKTLPVAYWRPGIAAMPVLLLAPQLFPASIELQFVAFVLFTALAILTCLGKQIGRAVLFPILFAITMIPIPQNLYDNLADMTRHITFSAALSVLPIFNIPFYKEGWLIKLPNALLEVAISCSGIRYLISYFVFGIAYAYLFRTTAIGRTLLVAATIPISLAASALRLTIIFLATYFISPRIAEHWPHIILSWCVFFMILFGLIFLDQYFLGKKKPLRKLDVATQPGHCSGY